MYVEALELLKTQLQEKFIDRYEDLQALFTTNCQISELPSRTGESKALKRKDDIDNLGLNKHHYVLYPEYNTSTNKASVGLSPMRPQMMEIIKDERAKVRLEEQSNDHIKKQQLPIAKELSNNQEYQLLIKVIAKFEQLAVQYQKVINSHIEDIFETFHELVKDPQTFYQQHKEQLKLGHNDKPNLKNADLAQVSQEITDLKKQNKQLQRTIEDQYKLTHELRKNYLKEINNLRESGAQGADKFKDALHVTFFDVAEGIDEKQVEILNLKLSDVRRQFLMQLDDKNKTINFQHELIQKYKKMAPKSFKMVEMSLTEIFSSVAVVEHDAMKIWSALTRAYPHGHFHGIIEDMFGKGTVSEDQLKQIKEDLEIMSRQSHREVVRASERLYVQIRQKDLIIQQRNAEITSLKEKHTINLKILTEDLRMQCEMKLRDLEKLLKAQFTLDLYSYKQQEEKHRQNQIKMKEEIARAQKQLFWVRMRAVTNVVIKYKRLEDIGVETLESTLDEQNLTQKQKEKRAFRLEKEAVAEAFFERVKILVLSSDVSRMQAKLDLRKEIMSDYKEKYEKAVFELFQLKVSVNQQIDDYDFTKLKLQEATHAQNRLLTNNTSMQNDLQKLTQESDVLREANRGCLNLVKIVEKQKEMLEDKYNSQLEENAETGQIILKSKIKPKGNEAEKTFQQRILERLQTELYGAFNAMTLSLHSSQIHANISQTLRIDQDVQTNIKNVELKIIQDTNPGTGAGGRKKQQIDSQFQDQFVQTKYKGEQFDYYIQQQQLEQEKLEKRMNKFQDKQDDDLGKIAKQLLLDEESGANQDQNEYQGLEGQDPNRLNRLKRDMIDHVKQELNEHNEALAHLMDPNDKKKKKVSKKEQGKKSKRNRRDMSENDTDTMEEGEETSGSRNREAGGESNRRNGKNGGRRRNKKDGEHDIGDSGSFINIRNGTAKNYKGAYSDHHHSDNEKSRVQIDILKDPRYFHFSKEFGVGFHEDGSVVFPKATEFKFDQDKYQKALGYLKKTQTIDPRKRMSRSQLERLYPTGQPQVFKRLEQEAANAVKKFDLKLKELQNMGQQAWMDKLQSQNFISEEQLLVLGAVSKYYSPHETPNSARILKVIDKMFKIGGSECSSPNLLGKKSGCIKITGLSQPKNSNNLSHVLSGIMQTGNESKLKKMVSAHKKRRSREQSQLKGEQFKTQEKVQKVFPHNNQDLQERRGSEAARGLILLKDDQELDIQTVAEKKQRLQELFNYKSSHKATESQKRRQINVFKNSYHNDLLMENYQNQLMIDQSCKEETSGTMNTSRHHLKMHQILSESGVNSGTNPTNVTIDMTPNVVKRPLMQSQHGIRNSNRNYRKNQNNVLHGFVDKMLTPPQTDIKVQNYDLLNFSQTPSNLEIITNLAQSQYLVDCMNQSEGLSVLKNERLNTPALQQPLCSKPFPISPPPQQSTNKLQAEIFGSTYSMDKRGVAYQMPKSIHNLIQNINLKHGQELKQHQQQILQQQTNMMKTKQHHKKVGAAASRL